MTAALDKALAAVADRSLAGEIEYLAQEAFLAGHRTCKTIDAPIYDSFTDFWDAARANPDHAAVFSEIKQIASLQAECARLREPDDAQIERMHETFTAALNAGLTPWSAFMETYHDGARQALAVQPVDETTTTEGSN